MAESRELASAGDLERETDQQRPVLCVVCGQDRLAWLGGGGDRRFVGSVGILGVCPESSVAFVGSCPSCDLDVCAGCARWVPAASLPGGVRGASLAERLARYPTCPRCSERLQGKSAHDLARLERGLDLLSQQPPAEARKTASRLSEVCRDEALLLGEMGYQAFLELRQFLIDRGTL